MAVRRPRSHMGAPLPIVAQSAPLRLCALSGERTLRVQQTGTFCTRLELWMGRDSHARPWPQATMYTTRTQRVHSAYSTRRVQQTSSGWTCRVRANPCPRISSKCFYQIRNLLLTKFGDMGLPVHGTSTQSHSAVHVVYCTRCVRSVYEACTGVSRHTSVPVGCPYQGRRRWGQEHQPTGSTTHLSRSRKPSPYFNVTGARCNSYPKNRPSAQRLSTA